MSLGGYKFAGRYCQKGSLTDAQWALQMHKTKVAAFMAANALSGAGWSFDQTGGDIAFGTYGNVIYSLDSVGNNYVSFLKQGTDSPVYLAILTCCLWGSVSSTGQIDGPYTLITSYSDSPYAGSRASAYHRISKVQLTISNLFTNMVGALGLYPAGLSCSSSSNSGMTYSSPNSYPNGSSYYQGYAIKGPCIISFAGSSISGDYINVSVIAGDGFSSLVNQSDLFGLFATMPLGYYSSSGTAKGESSECVYSSGSVQSSDVFTLSMDSSGTQSFGMLHYTIGSMYKTLNQQSTYPFSSTQILIEPDDLSGSCYKGTVKVDLLACSFPVRDSFSTSRLHPVANGNFLYAWKLNSSITATDASIFSSYYKFNFTQTLIASAYVGWDPSNPDITQASSWQLYDGT